MFDLEKILAHLKAHKGEYFTAKDLCGLQIKPTMIKENLIHLVKVGAVQRNGKKKFAYLYSFKADVALTSECKCCTKVVELRLMDGEHCGTCARRKKKYPTLHNNRRDELMAKLVATPFGLRREHYENLLKGTGNVTS